MLAWATTALSPLWAAPPSPPDLSDLDLGILLAIFNLLPSGREAARLAATCTRMSAARLLSKWPGVDPATGLLVEPLAFCAELSPGDDVQAAIELCPEGGSILLRAGVYPLARELRIDRNVCLFGRGRAALEGRGLNYAVRSGAAVAAVDGLAISGSKWGVFIDNGGLRAQHLALTAEFVGIYAFGVRARPTLLRNRATGGHHGMWWGFGAGGRAEHNDVAGCRAAGMRVFEVDPSLRIAHNCVRDGLGEGVWLRWDCPAAFALGPGNKLINNQRGAVVDLRAPPRGAPHAPGHARGASPAYLAAAVTGVTAGVVAGRLGAELLAAARVALAARPATDGLDPAALLRWQAALRALLRSLGRLLVPSIAGLVRGGAGAGAGPSRRWTARPAQALPPTACSS